MKRKKCQIYCFDNIGEQLSLFDVFYLRTKRVLRSFKRRIINMINRFNKFTRKFTKSSSNIERKVMVQDFQPGDLVRVRSKEEIQATLDNRNQLKKCTFMGEMWSYCGTKQRVKKQIRQFVDERDYIKKKSNGLVILEGITCEGTYYGGCDRSCFSFWRVEWLEKIE